MALKFIGERTIGALNGMRDGFVKDDLYRVYDAGILMPGGVSVNHGDFVSWDGTKWKLEANIKIVNTSTLNPESVPESASAENKLATESEIGSLKDGGALTSAASIDVPNNAVSTLSTSEAALTLNVNVGATEVPNFAVEITAGAAIALIVTKTVGDTVTTLYASAAGGNTLESGKFYQLTCVGSCWTLAEFTVPSP